MTFSNISGNTAYWYGTSTLSYNSTSGLHTQAIQTRLKLSSSSLVLASNLGLDSSIGALIQLDSSNDISANFLFEANYTYSSFYTPVRSVPTGWLPYNYGYNNWPTQYGVQTGLTFSDEYYYDPASTPAVPEPATMLLLGSGLLGLFGARRRFKK